jgi:DNA-binding NarL/FixJ family response regulator
MRILLADDQPDVRAALCLLLEQESGWRVVSEVSASENVLAFVEKTHPDLILLDWELSGMRGPEIVKTLRRLAPQTQIVALSSHSEARHASLDAGADAFISKGSPPETVLTALRTLMTEKASNKSKAEDPHFEQLEGRN